MIFRKQPAKICYGFSLAMLAGGAASRERPVDLVIQLGPIRDDHERPVAGNFAEHLLSEKNHRKAFAQPLSMPEDAQPAVPAPNRFQGFDGIVHAEELVVHGDDLLQIPRLFRKQGKVFDKVKQASRFTNAANDLLQRHRGFLFFALDLLPFGEMFPAGCYGSNSTIETVGEDQRSVRPEKLRNV